MTPTTRKRLLIGGGGIVALLVAALVALPALIDVNSYKPLIVGPRATDLIAEGQLIYNWEALPTDVAHLIHAHPSFSEAIGEAHLALAGRALHG